jgi:hypothetical protein
MKIKRKKWAAAFLTCLAIVGCRTASNVQEPSMDSPANVVQDQEGITLQLQNKPVFRYYTALCPVPNGVDPLYRRSGFVHPLWSPAGKVLTRIQPPDHYHHYGIWNPWTMTHINGREVDFWNLAKGQGTVRFAGVESVVCDASGGRIRVRQEHVDLTDPSGPRVAIEEVWEIGASAAQAEGRTIWIVDFDSHFWNVLDSPIILDAYRYGGGLGFRAAREWTKDNCTVLTSEGRTRRDADGQRARWCNVNGAFPDGTQAGILFFSHPENREHPEPMRIWPEDANGGRGDLFVEFCPIRLNSWTLEPGKKYRLRYRLVVYDGTLTPQTAEQLWTEYAKY